MERTPNAAAGNPETKSLDHDAPYKHAPPKDGDPWTIVLTSELEADTVRCNAWKEEVQNLLIFAGLFSAVVTTFVIESYTFLQQDPNAAVVGLLFQIANSLNATSSLPPSVSPPAILAPFSQTASAIRINVFWFISLILSLTTVLAGTIALQWLREHQSYVGYSGKEKLAILHMRKEAADAWYLPQVFAALPLLLQAALVLFLAGLIDFARPLGPALTIPISVVIGLILLFLTATTILPSLQGLCFFIGLYSEEALPTPCPYKSPQSDAFRTLYGVALRAVFRFFPAPNPSFEKDPESNELRWIIKNRPLLMPDHLAPPVYDLWYQKTWLKFDRAWLSLRDACHQRKLDDRPDLFHHRTLWKRSFPLSDVTQCLVKAVTQTPGTKHTESFLAALVYCFQELSESIWTAPPTLSLGSDIQRVDRRNDYFEQLHWKPSCSMAKFLLHGGTYKFERFGTHDHGLHEYIKPKITQRLLCDDQTVTFLRMLLENHNSLVLAQYQLELWSRILQSSSRITPLTPALSHGSFVSVPTIIEYPLIYSMMPDYLSGKTFSTDVPPCSWTLTVFNRSTDQRISTISNVLSTLLKLAASHRISQDRSMNSLCAHSHMGDVLDSMAYLTTLYLRLAPKDTRYLALRGVDSEFVRIFEFIGDNLNERLSDMPQDSQEISLDVFFYLSSIFVWGLLHFLPDQEVTDNQDSSFGQALMSLLDTLHKTWTSRQRNELIEERFHGFHGSYERFSGKWWDRIFQHVTGATEQVSASTEGSHTEVGLELSLQVIIPSENTIDVGTSPLLSATGYPIIEPSPNARPPDNDNDDQLASTRPKSEPQSPNEKSASDAPSVLNHPATTIDGPGDNGLAPEEVTENGNGHSDEHDPPLGERHLAIDIGLPDMAVQAEPINTLVVSDNSLPQQSTQEHVSIHMELPSEAGKSD